MQIQIKATNIELTPAIKDYAESRVLSLEKYLHENKEQALALVEVGKTTSHHHKGEIFRAEISILIQGERHYVSTEKDDLYAAIDEAKDEAAQELSRYKDKRQALMRRGRAKIKEIIKRLNWNR